MQLSVSVQPHPRLRDREDVRNVNRSQEYIETALKSVGSSGNWLARATQKKTWNDPNRRFKVRTLDQMRRTIGVRVKPGDNGSVWEFDLIGPANIEPRELMRIFQELQGIGLAEEIRESPCKAPVVEKAEQDFPQATTIHEPQETTIWEIAMQVEPAPVANGQATTTLSPQQMITMMTKLSLVMQRVQKRQDQKTELLRQKQDAEEELERLAETMGELDQMIRHIEQEEADDAEAAGAKQMMAAMHGVV